MKVTGALMLLGLPGLIKSFSHLRIGQVNRFTRLPGQVTRSLVSTSSTKLSADSSTQIDVMNNALSEIFLTPEEDELFTTLRQVVVDEALGTTVRVAGTSRTWMCK